METTTVLGKNLSRLGFGGMRFPLLEDGKTVDEERLAEMVDWAMAHGVNYFDTAYTYHDGRSEVALGRVLARHPRESYYLATKYPGHQPQESYDPAACVACGSCKQLCPQGVDVPVILAELDGMLKKIPKWADICRERMEIIRRERQGG